MSRISVGSFQWVGGVKDTRVVFMPNKNGRFKISWVPNISLQYRKKQPIEDE